MNTKYEWSAKNNAFIPCNLKLKYEKEGWDLSDLVFLSDSVLEEFFYSPPDGACRGVNDHGLPCWIPVPPLSQDELVNIAESDKAILLSGALVKISVWQTKLQLGRITDDEKKQLNLWLDYIDAVNAVDTSTAPDIKWPTPPVELAK